MRKQIIQQNPAHADAHNILGVALNAQGKSKEAVTTLKRAIKLAPPPAGGSAPAASNHRGANSGWL